MTNIIDNAQIFGGKKTIVSPGQRKQFGAVLWLINNYREQVYQVLVKHGFTPADKTVKSIIRALVTALQTDNEALRQDLTAIAKPGPKVSNFDFGIIITALSAITNLFKNKNKNVPPNDISEELIQLQIERERQQTMKNALIFGGIAIVGIIGIVVIIKATQS